MLNTTNNNFNAKKASIVAQFTVYTNSGNLSNLFNALEKNNIRISAFTMQERNNKATFKFVIAEGSNQISNDLNITRSILRQYKYNYDEAKAVKVTNSDNKLANQYRELNKNFSIYNFYMGENNSIIYETCCVANTLKALNQLS